MFDKLKNMYDAGRIDEKYLIQAIKLGWITEEEKNVIMGIAPGAPGAPVGDAPTAIPETYEDWV